MLSKNEIEKYNEILLAKLSYFLNFESSSITTKMVNNMVSELNINIIDAYKYLLASFIDINDQKIIKYYFNDMIHILDNKNYEDDLYYKNIKVDNISYNNYSFKIEKYNPYEAFVYNDLVVKSDGRVIPQIGIFEYEYKYISLLKGGREWMVITPNEIETMKEPIKKSFGHVLTYGLGLGYFAYMASLKDEVSDITIIENDKNIIDLFNKYIYPQFKNKDKIKIINKDAFEYAKSEAFNYDFVFADIWHDPSDGIDLYLKLKSFERPNIIYTYWIEKTMKYYIGE